MEFSNTSSSASDSHESLRDESFAATGDFNEPPGDDTTASAAQPDPTPAVPRAAAKQLAQAQGRHFASAIGRLVKSLDDLPDDHARFAASENMIKETAEHLHERHSRLLRCGVVIALCCREKWFRVATGADGKHIYAEEREYIVDLLKRNHLGQSEPNISRAKRCGELVLQLIAAKLPIPATPEPLKLMITLEKPVATWQELVNQAGGALPSTKSVQNVKTAQDQAAGKTKVPDESDRIQAALQEEHAPVEAALKLKPLDLAALQAAHDRFGVALAATRAAAATPPPLPDPSTENPVPAPVPAPDQSALIHGVALERHGLYVRCVILDGPPAHHEALRTFSQTKGCAWSPTSAYHCTAAPTLPCLTRKGTSVEGAVALFAAACAWATTLQPESNN